jgi:hypothetical protein
VLAKPFVAEWRNGHRLRTISRATPRDETGEAGMPRQASMPRHPGHGSHLTTCAVSFPPHTHLRCLGTGTLDLERSSFQYIAGTVPCESGKGGSCVRRAGPGLVAADRDAGARAMRGRHPSSRGRPPAPGPARCRRTECRMREAGCVGRCQGARGPSPMRGRAPATSRRSSAAAPHATWRFTAPISAERASSPATMTIHMTTLATSEGPPTVDHSITAVRPQCSAR